MTDPGVRSADPERDRVAAADGFLQVARDVAGDGRDAVLAVRKAGVRAEPPRALPVLEHPRDGRAEQHAPRAAPRLGEGAVALEEAAAAVPLEQGDRHPHVSELALAAGVLRAPMEAQVTVL